VVAVVEEVASLLRPCEPMEAEIGVEIHRRRTRQPLPEGGLPGPLTADMLLGAPGSTNAPSSPVGTLLRKARSQGPRPGLIGRRNSQPAFRA
jgi:hypothetical protein